MTHQSPDPNAAGAGTPATGADHARPLPAHPGYVDPAPRRRTAAWIVGGLVGAVAILAIAAGIAIVVSTQLGSGATVDAGAATDDSAAGGEHSPADDTYSFVEGLCETIDYSPVFDVLPVAATVIDSELDLDGASLIQCGFDLDHEPHLAALDVAINTYTRHDSARRDYDATLDIKREIRERWDEDVTFVDLEDELAETPEAADLPWHRGTFMYDTSTGTAVQLVVLEDNLVLELGFHTTARISDSGDLLGPRDALVQLADNVRDAIRP